MNNFVETGLVIESLIQDGISMSSISQMGHLCMPLVYGFVNESVLGEESPSYFRRKIEELFAAMVLDRWDGTLATFDGLLERHAALMLRSFRVSPSQNSAMTAKAKRLAVELAKRGCVFSVFAFGYASADENSQSHENEE